MDKLQKIMLNAFLEDKWNTWEEHCNNNYGVDAEDIVENLEEYVNWDAPNNYMVVCSEIFLSFIEASWQEWIDFVVKREKDADYADAIWSKLTDYL